MQEEVSKHRNEIEAKYNSRLLQKEEELREEMDLILQEKNKIKEQELLSKKEKMDLEDQLKAANIIAKEEAKKAKKLGVDSIHVSKVLDYCGLDH